MAQSCCALLGYYLKYKITVPFFFFFLDFRRWAEHQQRSQNGGSSGSGGGGTDGVVGVRQQRLAGHLQGDPPSSPELATLGGGGDGWGGAGTALAVAAAAAASGGQGGGFRPDGGAVAFVPPRDWPANENPAPPLIFNRVDLDGRSSVSEDAGTAVAVAAAAAVAAVATAPETATAMVVQEDGATGRMLSSLSVAARKQGGPTVAPAAGADRRGRKRARDSGGRELCGVAGGIGASAAAAAIGKDKMTARKSAASAAAKLAKAAAGADAGAEEGEEEEQASGRRTDARGGRKAVEVRCCFLEGVSGAVVCS